MKRTGLILLIIISITTVTTCCGAEIDLQSYWLTDTVTIDGRMTNSQEWSESSYTALLIGNEEGSNPPYTSVFIWVKNTEKYVYLLYWIQTQKTDYDIYDKGALFYHWNTTDTLTHSDGVEIRQIGGAKDLCNETNGNWSTDSELGGTTDVIGAGRYDGIAYWFEFRKELNSSDIYDWEFKPGEKIGGHNTPQEVDKLLVAFYDASADLLLQKPVRITLASDPTTKIRVGGKLVEQKIVNSTIVLFLISTLCVFCIIFYIGYSWRKIQVKNMSLNSLYMHQELPHKLNKGKDSKLNIKEINIIDNMAILPLIKKFRQLDFGLYVTSFLDNIKKIYKDFDKEYLSPLLLGLILVCFVLALIIIITNNRNIDDIVYPYLGSAMTILTSRCH